jgi:hypothetical protein
MPEKWLLTAILRSVMTLGISRRFLSILFGGSLAAACGTERTNGGDIDTFDDLSEDDEQDSDLPSDSGSGSSDDGESETPQDDDDDDDDDDDGGSDVTHDLPKFDLVSVDLDELNECGGPVGTSCTCTAVDILFVIDNSVSMGVHQDSLGQAFPEFVRAISESLSAGVEVRVGVTSTEMGFASLGVTDGCSGLGADSAYITPDQSNTGRPVAQGRMVRIDGKPYTSFASDGSAAELQAASDWFVRAASLGINGSNIEMSSATAGWAFDPVNADANDHFVRDEGAVLVVFFVQDEPDQTPTSVSGADLFAKLEAAKSKCGGAKCIIGGGMIDLNCMPRTPIGDFLDLMGKPPVVEQIPSLQASNPEKYIKILKDTLAGVIEETCSEITPPK